MAADTSPESIMAQAQALIDQVQRDLDAGDALYRDLGLDPDSTRAALQAQLTPELHAQAREAFEKDKQDIEDQFREDLARAGLTAPSKSPKPTRRPRFMV
ncbi:hypothetical protein [Pantoea sp. 18069]|uniref:hypothetical protein n=1 Tax=Pantoea sp. 18069 TaxID=2681415 RepID=UPI001358480F|nr:hypothetical protein [Pantoea sp. 18069]